MGDAIGFERAVGAARIFGSANERAEFHEGLIEVGAEGSPFGRPRWGERPRESSSSRREIGSRGRSPHRHHQFFRNTPKPGVGFLFARVAFDAEEARQDANDVAVQNRRGLIECDAADCAGGVAADAGQREHGIKFARKFAIMFFHYELRGSLNVADASVVAEAFPEFMNFLRTGFSERLDVGQGRHPPFPVRQDGVYLGLLKHDFGDPDGVGIASATPRKIAGVVWVPLEQR